MCEEKKPIWGNVTLKGKVLRKYFPQSYTPLQIEKEVGSVMEWTDAEAWLRQRLGLDDSALYAILKMVFDNLHSSPFWSITPEFIMELGKAYFRFVYE